MIGGGVRGRASRAKNALDITHQVRDAHVMQSTRTTVAIDDDVLAYARQLAEDSGKPLGTVLSDLARCGMRTKAPATTRNGIRLLPAPQGARRATLDHVNKLRDDIP